MYVKYCNIFQFWVILHNILSFSWVWGFHGLFLPVALTEKKGLFFIGSIYSFSHDTTFWVDKAARFCFKTCQNWGIVKYGVFIQKCKQTGNFPKTLFLMNIQSKSNILCQFWNTRGCCKIFLTHILHHTISYNKNYAFTSMYTQSWHFENSKMVKWVYITQKLTKMLEIM